MTKHTWIHLVFVVFSLVGSPICHAKKDVLFIAVDDFRTQLGSYGEDAAKTPNMDALSARSMVFERAYCQVAVCAPSRTSLLTGRRPDTNHVWRVTNDQYWRTFTNATTIPQYFKDNGYTSIGMGKIFHRGVQNGRDDIEYSWSVPYYHPTDDVQSPNSWQSFENISDSALREGKLADRAIQTLQEIKQNREQGDDTPFFLAIGFYKPHLPFFAPSEYYDLYPPADEILLPNNPNAPRGIPPIAWSISSEIRDYPDIMGQYSGPRCRNDSEFSMNGDRCRIADPDSRLLRRAYYASVSFVDAQVGRILTELENQGLSNETIIVLWSDHGYKLGELNMWGKFTNLESDTRVPFLLRVPGLTDDGLRTDALVELIDIFPSLTELAGLKVPPLCPENNEDLLTCVEGSSVVPLLNDPNRQWKRGAFSQYPRSFSGLTVIPGRPPFDSPESVMGYAIRVDTYRFVEWYGFDPVNAQPDFNDTWGTELYNHTQPTMFFDDENENLADNEDMADLVNELRGMLQAGWRAALPPGSDTTAVSQTEEATGGCVNDLQGMTILKASVLTFMAAVGLAMM